MNKLYLEIGLDGTQSMHEIFSAVYGFVKNGIEAIQRYKNEGADAEVFYGLSVFHGGTEEAVAEDYESFVFGGGEYYTAKGDEVLDRLKKLMLSGGSEDGYEPQIVPAIEKMLEKLQTAGNPEEDSRALLFISDSLPGENKKKQYKVKVDRLRFAHMFFYDKDAFQVIINAFNSQNDDAVGEEVTQYGIGTLLDKDSSQEKTDELLGVVQKTSMLAH